MRSRSIVAVLVVVAALAVGCGRSDKSPSAGGTSTTAAAECKDTPKATDVGITADSITIEVMADVGSPLAPGLFQGNVDAMNAFAKYTNDNGGLACRKLVVKTWDSKLSADESKNGLIDACKNALALVGGNALFNPDQSPATGCADKAGKATGLPDIAALANNNEEACNPQAFVIAGISEKCPVTLGQPRPITVVTGPGKWWVNEFKGTKLHGIYLIAGDLPGPIQSEVVSAEAFEKTGIVWDGLPKVSGRDEQVAYTPRIQTMNTNHSNFVFNGSNDRAMINAEKEAKAQGYTGVKLWGCGLSCYTRAFLQAGPDVEGTYVWMQFLPFEEASSNKELKAYVDSVGANKIDSFGAQAWQAGVLFRQAVNDVVSKSGPNGLTRASLLDALNSIHEFDANGMMGTKDPKGMSACYVMMQVKGGKYVRVYPEKPGTFDCDPGNLTTVTVDPAVEAKRAT